MKKLKVIRDDKEDLFLGYRKAVEDRDKLCEMCGGVNEVKYVKRKDNVSVKLCYACRNSDVKAPLWGWVKGLKPKG